MGLNRMFMGRKTESSGGGTPENVFIMTMGQQGSQYGMQQSVKLKAMLRMTAEL